MRAGARRFLPADSAALQDLPDLVRNLTREYLEDCEIPFASPETFRALLGRLEFWRLPGVGRRKDRVCRSVPPVLLEGLAAFEAPFAYIVRHGEQHSEFTFGLPGDRAEAVARSLHGLFGGPAPVRTEPPLSALPPFVGCLSGWPRSAGNSGTGRPDASAMDRVLDVAGARSWAYTVFATPEPVDEARRQLAAARTLAQDLEREHLADPLGRSNRLAQRALNLLDRVAKRLEGGRALWRTTAFGGSDDAELCRFALALLAGALRDGDGIGIPLRAAACGEGGEYALHQDVLLSEELANLCLLPQRDRPGFAIRIDASFDVDHHVAAGGIPLGIILDGETATASPLTVPAHTLCRHALVAGMTGSGKSTTVRSLLVELAARDTPFLVLEPAKAEYRSLAGLHPGLLVFRVGAPPAADEVPFQFNPFYFPEGFGLQTHIDLLKQAMVASFGLFPPGPYLLETAIYRVFERRGWNLGTGTHPLGRQRLAFPTLSDLLAEIDPVVEAAGYDREITRNLKGALRTRIGNLCAGVKGAMLDTRENLPDDLLFGSSVVLELKDLGSDEEKALIMGLVLTRLYEVRESRGVLGGERLVHLLVIEEAHRLLRKAPERSAEEGDMQGQAVETFANILSEVRAYGQGVLVVEQLPGKLAPDVVKNSSLKILHRMAPRDDRDSIGDTMNLDDEQKRYVAVLRQGEAIVHTEGMDAPVRARMRPVVQVGATARPGELEARVGSRLPAAAAGRFELARLRARHAQILQAGTVRQAADRLILGLIAGAAPAALWERLGDAVTRTMPGERVAEAARDEAAGLACREALTRVALHHRWSDADMEAIAAAIIDRDRDGAVFLNRQLAIAGGPHAFCAGCPQPCRFGAFGSRLAGQPDFRDTVAYHVARVDSEAPASLFERALREAAHAYDYWERPFPAVLGYCALGHAFDHLGVARPVREALETAILQELSPERSAP